MEHLRALILELGKGFAFVGSQYHLEVGGQDYYVDLLFYHFPAPMGPSVTVLLP
ncbi:PDDEXK nuclease domain-containing protein [Mesorhizobium sp. M2A.F.Ca.ET.067.02.1.1]|uniref:PDDEXK nuclease domain-containing protein n=1 Tax=Mesorhizobium sp. M2A.F.Ca.ET.067.02.1.1 TaxID=2496749 RepID=UPI0024796CC6|nr:PDDEXK nuclease domain-containing protein [Mesorhizobium sp. M2A.F.Ca.ET.067.02.1.1]